MGQKNQCFVRILKNFQLCTHGWEMLQMFPSSSTDPSQHLSHKTSLMTSRQFWRKCLNFAGSNFKYGVQCPDEWLKNININNKPTMMTHGLLYKYFVNILGKKSGWWEVLYVWKTFCSAACFSERKSEQLWSRDLGVE